MTHHIAETGERPEDVATEAGPTVARIMTHLVMTSSPDDSLDQTARILREWHISGLPVVEEGRVVGVISEKDLVLALHKAAGVAHPRGLLDLLLESSPTRGANILAVCRRRLQKTRVREVMSRPAVTVYPETSLLEAARLMKVNGLGRLPVVDRRDQLVGIIARSDIASDLAAPPAHARGSLHPAPSRTRSRARRPDPFADI